MENRISVYFSSSKEAQYNMFNRIGNHVDNYLRHVTYIVYTLSKILKHSILEVTGEI